MGQPLQLKELHMAALLPQYGAKLKFRTGVLYNQRQIEGCPLNPLQVLQGRQAAPQLLLDLTVRKCYPMLMPAL